MGKAIGIDIGGTFTDIVISDDVTGEMEVDKVLTTPADPTKAVIDYLSGKFSSMYDISFLVHGTTIATNAVVEMKGAKLGLITTRGQRDRLDLQRTNWLRMYDVTYQKPQPLIPWELRREVTGRTLYDGTILTPIDKAEIIEVARELIENHKVEGICVCFLNSYVNSTQELEVKSIIKQNFPGTYVLTSCETLAEVLEYERFSTGVISAYLMPVMDKYLERLETFLGERGLPKERFMIMQGNGGMASAKLAREMAGYTVESGPAGGVTASQYLAELAGIDDVITLDMGGTTTDVCLIKQRQSYVTLDYKVAGHPMRFPLLDIYSIGAGGGSIAWIDDGGGLHVGPQSAGADPGPACYGFGGVEPTISDTHMILGRLLGETLLGGKMKLRLDLAEKALNNIASYYKTSIKEAAASIIRIVDEKMLNALRVISVEKGIDPQGYTLVAYGGAGPMHAGALIKRLKMSRCIVPPFPGCHSAYGLIAADIKHDYVRSILRPTAELDIDFVRQIYQSLEQKAREDARREGVPDKDLLIEYKCDMRYIGQAYVPAIIPFSWHAPRDQQLAETEKTFRKFHFQLYKHAGEQPTEIISLRVSSIGKREKPRPIVKKIVARKPELRKGNVYFEDIDRVVSCDIYEREQLPVGFSLKGPAIVYQMDATTLIFPDQRASIDEFGCIVIEEIA